MSGSSWGKGMCQAAVGVRVGLCVRVHLGQGYVSGSSWLRVCVRVQLAKGMCQGAVGARVCVRLQLGKGMC